MKQKKLLILFFVFISTIIGLTVIFYWQAKKEIIIESPVQGPPNLNQLPKSLENEKEPAASSPFEIKGEISAANPDKKQVVFTFDAGAGANSFVKILEIAKNHNIKTTFFITGNFAEKFPDLVRQAAGQGHEIFNHTFSHPHLTQMTDEQIENELIQAEQIISNITGAATLPYFRPPYKERDKRVLAIARGLGYQSVVWTIDALDWMNGKTDQEVKQRIYDNLKPGALILMHAGDNITGNILDEVFTHAESQGYKIVSLTEGIK
jgi:peptidoglycan/xylan/chitin deacetylase (PgdA/CDA1 family)